MRARLPARRWSLRLASTLALGLLAGLAFATTYRFMTPVELLANADVVFTARVVDVTAAVSADKAYEEVYTTVSFAVEEVLRGYGVRLRPDQAPDAGDGDPDETDPDELAGPPDTIELDFLGGEAPGDRRLLVAGSPSWRTGDSVLVAAYLDPDLASPLTGFRQGLWRLGDDGFVDLDGRALGLDPNGRLTRTDLPAAPAVVLEAIRALLSGEVPAAAPSEEPDAAPPAEGPDGADQEESAAEGPQQPPLEVEEPAEPAPEAPVPDEPVQDDAAEEEPAADDQAADAAPPPEPVAATYRVDDAGGPLLLSDALAAAAATWRESSAGLVELTEADSAPYSFSYGDPALFSAETLSLTLVRDVSGSGEVTALLSPDAGGMLGRALHHELGLLLGLPAGGEGVMAMAVSDASALPGEAELAELSAVSRFAAGDLSRDGTVDFLDLLEFAVAYGRTGLNQPADLDGDGDVDDDDLALLRESYQLTPPARP